MLPGSDIVNNIHFIRYILNKGEPTRYQISMFLKVLKFFRQGQANSLLVITQGPHTDQTLDGPGLVQYVKSAADPAKPVAINVIDFGDDSDRATWEAVAEASGGTYQNVATSDSPDLATAVSTLLN